MKWENDPKSGRNGYTNSGFKRCVDVGRIVKYKDKEFTVIDINHEGHKDVQKVRLQLSKGKEYWFLVESLEIMSKDENPEYYL